MPNDQNSGASRRVLLCAGAVGAAALGAVGVAQAAVDAASLGSARSARSAWRSWRVNELRYREVAYTSHATERLTYIVKAFCAATSLHHAAGMVSFFAPAPAPVRYIDAGPGLE